MGENFVLQEYIEQLQRKAEQYELMIIELRTEVDRLSTFFDEARDNERLHSVWLELEREVERLCHGPSNLHSSTHAMGSNERHR